MWEILLAMLVGAGAVLAACLLPERFYRLDEVGCRLVLIPGVGDGTELERNVRQVLGLRDYGCVPVIADIGLSGEGQEMALRLAQQWPEVLLCPVDCLGDLLCRTCGTDQ